jgi:uncharacterized membrane protein YfcA
VSLLEAVAIFFAGMAAGTINTVVGSGTLVTFPVLLAFGYPPVVANVTNTVGLVPGGVSGVLGGRAELAGQRPRVLRLGTASVLGGVTGAVALLVLPAKAFETIVPAFIAVALILIVLQPRLQDMLAHRERPAAGKEGPGTLLATYLTGIYGGYFGAAQGIMLLGFLGVLLPESLHRINALKNVLATLVNAVAALIFIAVADISWGAAAALAVGSMIGGQIGARYGRRLSPAVLRGLIVAVGVTAMVQLLARG